MIKETACPGLIGTRQQNRADRLRDALEVDLGVCRVALELVDLQRHIVVDVVAQDECRLRAVLHKGG